MEKIDELLMVGVLLVLLGEVTYLVAKLPRQATGGNKRMMFVDTSVLIDGRIIPVVASGFVSDTIAIPQSVLGELQFLADNADAEKRARARHGLDIVKELQGIEVADVQIFEDGSKAEEGVDERLINLAKQHDGAICTIDYNLNKVAAVQGITVCNINELAKNLRMAYLPGEKMKLELIQKGQDNHQGVGYLPDGTMVVVEQASAQIGQIVEVEFIRSLQTAAGKMMFAKKVTGGSVEPGLKQVESRQASAEGRPANQSRSPRRQQKPVGTKPVQGKQAPRRQNSRRRPDHEADLINLVDNQQ